MPNAALANRQPVRSCERSGRGFRLVLQIRNGNGGAFLVWVRHGSVTPTKVMPPWNWSTAAFWRHIAMGMTTRAEQNTERSKV